ncbi:hypothetical protein QCA50_010955 [Cerrena zonata]|uniref:Uncharacterized protein n=1 Tax=Cerrena zonata TaxID=2478898 RepID=A0AAW0FYI8_9APHY
MAVSTSTQEGRDIHHWCPQYTGKSKGMFGDLKLVFGEDYSKIVSVKTHLIKQVEPQSQGTYHTDTKMSFSFIDDHKLEETGNSKGATGSELVDISLKMILVFLRCAVWVDFDGKRS